MFLYLHLASLGRGVGGWVGTFSSLEHTGQLMPFLMVIFPRSSSLWDPECQDASLDINFDLKRIWPLISILV